jgi:hypothetical protein
LGLLGQQAVRHGWAVCLSVTAPGSATWAKRFC